MTTNLLHSLLRRDVSWRICW